MEFTGTQKIAVILLALGDKFASDVFNRMTRSEITNISRAIMELDSVSKEEVERFYVNSTWLLLTVWTSYQAVRKH